MTSLFKTHEDFRAAVGTGACRVGSAGAGGRPYTCQSTRSRLQESRSWGWHLAKAAWHEREPEAEGKKGLWAGEVGLRRGKGNREGMGLRLEFALRPPTASGWHSSRTPLLGARGRSPWTPTRPG